jgi:hypothetical protein
MEVLSHFFCFSISDYINPYFPYPTKPAKASSYFYSNDYNG